MSLPEVPLVQSRNLRRSLGIALTLTGLGLFVLGAKPAWLGLDRSPAIGFVQIGVFSFGLLVLCIGATMTLDSLWPTGSRSIAADIGLRLTWTGYVFALFSALADLIGLGTRRYPYHLPFFGDWQARGVLLGQLLMVIGLAMMVPYRPVAIQNGDNAELN